MHVWAPVSSFRPIFPTSLRSPIKLLQLGIASRAVVQTTAEYTGKHSICRSSVPFPVPKHGGFLTLNHERKSRETLAKPRSDRSSRPGGQMTARCLRTPPHIGLFRQCQRPSHATASATRREEEGGKGDGEVARSSWSLGGLGGLAQSPLFCMMRVDVGVERQ